MNRHALRLLALAMAALSTAPGLPVRIALAAQPTPAGGATWAPNQRVEYRWKEGSEPPGWAKSAMSAAAADSNSSRKSNAAIFSHAASGPAWLAYTDDLPTSWAIGYTVRNVPNSFTIRMRPHGTQLDWGTLRWCEFYGADAPNGCYDLEMVTLHEFGHAQTLGHVDEAAIDSYTDSLMHAIGLHSKAKLGWNQHVYGRCDVARLQIRYAPLSSSTAISTCLDLDTNLTLSVPTSADYGSAVTFTAKLKIHPAEIYPNLAGRPLSARAVALQRRAPGATSWTTVTTLSAVADDSGRYVKTLTLTATYDWRAVFSKPGDEGLKGSSSPASRISVDYACPSTDGDATDPSPDYETC